MSTQRNLFTAQNPTCTESDCRYTHRAYCGTCTEPSYSGGITDFSATKRASSQACVSSRSAPVLSTLTHQQTVSTLRWTSWHSDQHRFMQQCSRSRLARGFAQRPERSIGVDADACVCDDFWSQRRWCRRAERFAPSFDEPLVIPHLIKPGLTQNQKKSFKVGFAIL